MGRLKQFFVAVFATRSVVRVSVGVLLVAAVLGTAVWQGLINRAEGPSPDGGGTGYVRQDPTALVVEMPTAAGACAPPP